MKVHTIIIVSPGLRLMYSSALSGRSIDNGVTDLITL